MPWGVYTTRRRRRRKGEIKEENEEEVKERIFRASDSQLVILIQCEVV